MRADTALSKQENSASSTMTAVDVESDSDDSVIHVPFVKPNPPVISLDDSDGGEVDESPNKLDDSVNTGDDPAVSPFLTTVVTPTEEIPEIITPEKQRRKEKKRKRKENESPTKKKKNKKGDKKTKRDKAKTGEPDDGIVQKKKSNLRKQKKNHADGSSQTVLESDCRSTSVETESAQCNADPGPLCEDATGLISIGTSPNKKKTRKRKATKENHHFPGEYEEQVLGHAPPIRPRKKKSKPSAESELISEAAAAPTPTDTVTTSSSESVSPNASTTVSNASLPSTCAGTTDCAHLGSSDGVSEIPAKNLTPADIDHYKFLKTLNLTGNIGFDESDLLNMILSPADFRKRTKRVRSGVSNKSPKGKAKKSGEGKAKDDEHSSFSLNEPESAVERSTSPAKDQSPQPSNSIVINTSEKDFPSVVEELTTKDVAPTATTSPGSFVSVVHEKNSIKKGSKRAAKQPVVENVVTRSDDDEDRHFTVEELNAVRSHLQLNVVGINLPGCGLVESIDKGTEVGKTSTAAKANPDSRIRPKDFRYFNAPGPSSQTVDEGRSGGIRNNQEKDQSSQKKKDRKDSSGERTLKKRREDRKGKEKKKRKSVDNHAENNISKRRKKGNPSDEGAKSVEMPKVPVERVNCKRLMKERAFPSTWTQSMIDFYGTVDVLVPDVETILSRIPNGSRLWRAPLDEIPFRRRGKMIRCDNCNNYGDHVTMRCPEPRRPRLCIMCGETGHSTGCLYPNETDISRGNYYRDDFCRAVDTFCKSTLCLNCGHPCSRKGRGDFVQRCQKCTTRHGDIQPCRICGVRHPTTQECPDNWRRFYSTKTDISKEELNKIISKKNAELQDATYREIRSSFCSNCGRRGHIFFECNRQKDLNSVFVPQTPKVSRELPKAVLEAKPLTVIAEKVPQIPEDSTFPVSREEGLPSLLSDVDTYTNKQQTTASDVDWIPVNHVEKIFPSMSDQSSTNKAKSQSPEHDIMEIFPEQNMNENSPTETNITITLDDDDDVQIIDIESDKESSPQEISGRSINVTSDPPGSTDEVTSVQLPAPVDCSSADTQSLLKEKTVEVCTDFQTNVLSVKKPLLTDTPCKQRVTLEFQNSSVSQERPSSGCSPRDSENSIDRVSRCQTLRTTNPKKKNDAKLVRCMSADCTNFVIKGRPCRKITMRASTHCYLLELDAEFKIVEKLNMLYAKKKLNICMRKKGCEFHISGNEKERGVRVDIVRIIRWAEQRNEKGLQRWLSMASGNSPSKSDSSVHSNNVRNCRGQSSSKQGKESDKQINPSPDVEHPATSSDNKKEKSVSATGLVDQYENPPSVEAINSLPPTTTLGNNNDTVVKDTLNIVERNCKHSEGNETTKRVDSNPNVPVISRYEFERRLRRIACLVSKKPTPDVDVTEDASEVQKKSGDGSEPTSEEASVETTSAPDIQPASTESKDTPTTVAKKPNTTDGDKPVDKTAAIPSSSSSFTSSGGNHSKVRSSPKNRNDKIHSNRRWEHPIRKQFNHQSSDRSNAHQNNHTRFREPQCYNNIRHEPPLPHYSRPFRPSRWDVPSRFPGPSPQVHPPPLFFPTTDIDERQFNGNCLIDQTNSHSFNFGSPWTNSFGPPMYNSGIDQIPPPNNCFDNSNDANSGFFIGSAPQSFLPTFPQGFAFNFPPPGGPNFS